MEGFEIERKFLVKSEDWKKSVVEIKEMKQIYFSPDFFYCLFHRDLEKNKVFFEIHNEDHALSIEVDEKTKEIILLNPLIVFDQANNFNLNNEKWLSRLRIEKTGKVESAEITVKGPHAGIMKPEYNFNVNYKDAISIFNSKQGLLCQRVEKVRNIVPSGDENTKWEIDVFSYPESVKGLILAEIEIPDIDYSIESIRPCWIGEDVSENPKYFNKNMV
jgi:CYTH domain-containing protein